MNQLQPSPAIFKIKKDKLDKWRQWCARLQSEYKEEALKTLEEEGVLCEGFAVFQINSDWYTIGFGITADGADPKPAKEDNPLNDEHRRMKRECLELVGKGEFLYWL